MAQLPFEPFTLLRKATQRTLEDAKITDCGLVRKDHDVQLIKFVKLYSCPYSCLYGARLQSTSPPARNFSDYTLVKLFDVN